MYGAADKAVLNKALFKKQKIPFKEEVSFQFINFKNKLKHGKTQKC
jgi:hypothetical protein